LVVSLKLLAKYDLVYFSTPYSKYNRGLTGAFIDAAKISAQLMLADVNVYSPVVMCHPMAVHGGIEPLNHDLWLKFDSAMIAKSDALLVGQLDGWDESFGVAHEISAFSRAKKPIHYLNPITLELVLEN
jgi:hypothetical protein